MHECCETAKSGRSRNQQCVPGHPRTVLVPHKLIALLTISAFDSGTFNSGITSPAAEMRGELYSWHRLTRLAFGVCAGKTHSPQRTSHARLCKHCVLVKQTSEQRERTGSKHARMSQNDESHSTFSQPLPSAKAQLRRPQQAPLLPADASDAHHLAAPAPQATEKGKHTTPQQLHSHPSRSHPAAPKSWTAGRTTHANPPQQPERSPAEGSAREQAESTPLRSSHAPAQTSRSTVPEPHVPTGQGLPKSPQQKPPGIVLPAQGTATDHAGDCPRNSHPHGSTRRAGSPIASVTPPPATTAWSLSNELSNKSSIRDPAGLTMTAWRFLSQPAPGATHVLDASKPPATRQAPKRSRWGFVIRLKRLFWWKKEAAARGPAAASGALSGRYGTSSKSGRQMVRTALEDRPFGRPADGPQRSLPSITSVAIAAPPPGSTRKIASSEDTRTSMTGGVLVATDARAAAQPGCSGKVGTIQGQGGGASATLEALYLARGSNPMGWAGSWRGAGGSTALTVCLVLP
jgi:hypothetical protein